MPDRPEAKDYEQLGRQTEAVLIRDYVELLQKPYRRWWYFFVTGIFRGLGWVVGTTLMVALLILLLQKLTGLPIVGHFFDYLTNTIKK